MMNIPIHQLNTYPTYILFIMIIEESFRYLIFKDRERNSAIELI